MTTWFISRHPGAERWMKANGIHYDHHLTHLEGQPIAAGDTVIGSLPVNLAAEVCAKGAHYWNLSLILPEGARGRELSADELDLYQARLEAFSISQNPAAPNPLPERSAGDKEQPAPQAAEPATQSAHTPAPQTAQSAPAQPATQTAEPAHSSTPDRAQISTWQRELFKKHVFNQDNPARGEQEAEKFLDSIRHLLQTPELLQKFEATSRQGRHAVNLSAALLKRINLGTPADELQAWVDQQKQSQSPRIGRHLQITLDKATAFSSNKQKQNKANRDFNISLPYTQVENGLHPQSLRAMQPADSWNLYIDETGNRFDTGASELNETSSALGRIIALAIPHHSRLQPLKEQLHAVDLNYNKIQELLKDIQQSKAGILGATLKQDLLGHNWMSAVHQLARWALLLLPMTDDKPCRVRIHIEARAPYTSDAQLLALQDTLENELKSLLPQRFESLSLSLHIMSKENPYNGYVDAIANCWGSNDPVKRKLLTRTGWRGHCLLQTSELERIEDIYRSISTGEHVSGYHWFELCVASINEPASSMLHDMLDQLGQISRQQPGTWLDYLQETRHRLERKDFTPASLQIALAWLQNWQTENQQLPAHLQLELLSLQLASGNHLGETHLQRVGQLLSLISQLTDEAPAQACQALLRIAVRSTHLYDFASTEPLLQQWLDYPVAVPGLLNHAKLHSTRGQLLAFQGKNDDALAAFEQALQAFGRLSDDQQSKREIQQTSLYRAVLLQDMQHANSAEATFHLAKQATRRTGN